jgi:hypothetical protein
VWSARTGRQAGILIKHVIPAVIKPARTLWNEVIGFFFLCLGTIFGFAAVRAAINHDALRAWGGGLCTLLMAWYGVGSFLRARKISRS